MFFEEIPEKTKSLVLIFDDPDAPGGVFLHWLLYDMPVVKELKEGAKLGKAGKNSFQVLEYGGPASPFGVHRYFFKLYALDSLLDLKEGSSLAEVQKKMQGHVLAEAHLMGLFGKKD